LYHIVFAPPDMSPFRLFLTFLLIAAAAIGFVLLSKDRLNTKQAIKERRRGYMKQVIDSARTARDWEKDSLRRARYESSSGSAAPSAPRSEP
jgi:hypothetical protein